MISIMDSRVLDANSECLGVPVKSLMESAGKALAEIIDSECTGRTLIICGNGNNGGDGYTAAKFCKSNVTVTSFKKPKSPLCIEASNNIKSVPYEDVKLTDYNLIVDCVLGTGVEGNLRPEYTEYISSVNQAGIKVISCDVPTGFGTETLVKSDITVTFHDIKEGMSQDNCGKVVIADIGIPTEAIETVNSGDFLRYPVSKKDSHKGQNGRLLIIGGGPYIGAPVSSALSALRVGVDLVTVATPKTSFVPIASMSPAYMVKQLTSDVLCMDDVPLILKMSENVDAVLIGPGLGLDEKTIDAVRELVQRLEIPTVIDADGITAIANNIPRGKDLIFTPHGKELIRLIDNPSDDSLYDFCSMYGTVVRKGPVDLIYCSSKSRKNHTGCPAMTVGGTGDVLSGIIAGLRSKGMDSFDAACLGTHICGLAGERAFSEHSYGMTSVDVTDEIGHVLKERLHD